MVSVRCVLGRSNDVGAAGRPVEAVVVMARPRKINPDGPTRRIAAPVHIEVYERLLREARNRNVTLAQIIREKVEAK